MTALPSTEEILAALNGAWRLLQRDPDALNNFEQTPSAFWRSFMVFILLVPLYAVFVTTQWRLWQDAGYFYAVEPFVLWSFAGIVAGWIVFPLIVAGIAAATGTSARYATYIIVYNWTSLPLAFFALPPILLYSVGVLGATETQTLGFFLLFPMLAYRWLVALTAFGVSPVAAAGLTCLDFALSLLIDLAVTLQLGTAGIGA